MDTPARRHRLQRPLERRVAHPGRDHELGLVRCARQREGARIAFVIGLGRIDQGYVDRVPRLELETRGLGEMKRHRALGDGRAGGQHGFVFGHRRSFCVQTGSSWAQAIL